MNRWTLILLCLSVLSTVIMIFLYIGAARERDFFMKVNTSYWKQLKDAEIVGGFPKAADEDRIKDLETDIANGCQIIDNQKATINSLRALLAQSQARNKRQKGGK
jgi:hypothetical protein